MHMKTYSYFRKGLLPIQGYGRKLQSQIKEMKHILYLNIKCLCKNDIFTFIMTDSTINRLEQVLADHVVLLFGVLMKVDIFDIKG